VASIRKEIAINASVEKVWAAIRDIGNTHKLFAGVVARTQLEDGAGSRVTWIIDVLPNEVVAGIQPLVEMGSAAVKKALEQA